MKPKNLIHPAHEVSASYAMLLFAALIFASNHILSRHLNEMLPPFGTVFWRFAIGGLVMVLITGRSFYSNWHLIKENIWFFLSLSILFVPLANGLIYLSYQWTTATNGGVISTIQPALTVTLSAILFRDLINRKQASGLIIATIGVLVIISRGEFDVLINLQFNTGDLTLLSAMFAGALYNVLIRRVPAEINALLLTFIVQILGVMVTLPLYIIESIYFQPISFTSEVIVALIWFGVAVGAIAVCLHNAVIRKLGANKASMGNYLRAIFTTLLAIGILGESFEPHHGIALILVISGVWLLSMAPSFRQ